jgi:hypothetical protein
MHQKNTKQATAQNTLSSLTRALSGVVRWHEKLRKPNGTVFGGKTSYRVSVEKRFSSWRMQEIKFFRESQVENDGSKKKFSLK